MSNSLQFQILRYVCRGHDWAKNAAHPYCFLRVVPERKQIQVRRWGLVTRDIKEPHFLWKRIDLRKSDIESQIRSALDQWRNFPDYEFNRAYSDMIPEAGKKIPPSRSYFGL